MPTAVDNSVLLDVLLDDPRHGQFSEAALREAADDGLIVCETVIAEIAPAFTSSLLHEFLSDWQIKFVPSSLESASLAGQMFRLYLERGGKRGRIVPDFLIAAHAQIHADGFLARDRGYFRDYFEKLNLRELEQKK